MRGGGGVQASWDVGSLGPEEVGREDRLFSLPTFSYGTRTQPALTQNIISALSKWAVEIAKCIHCRYICEVTLLRHLTSALTSLYIHIGVTAGEGGGGQEAGESMWNQIREWCGGAGCLISVLRRI